MRFGWYIVSLILIVNAFQAVASGPSLSVIRDVEIEKTIRDLATPIFNAAKLKPENIHIIIINDPQINAFVAGGMNLFLYTGLLTEFDNANVLQGVIAHETGHIAGGHLARGSERYADAAIGATLGYVLGAAAAVGGSPQAAMAIIAGSSQINQREVLQFSRENEQAADQAGLNFLDKTHASSEGLLTLLQFLGRKENLLYGELNPYTLTHPLSRERVTHIRNHFQNSPYKSSNISPELELEYARCYVKLQAFLQPASETLKHYPPKDKSLKARYARAIAYYKQPDLTRALGEINSLIRDYPKDPYFYEFKGQMLFESSHVSEAVAPYQRAVQLKPDAPLLRLGLGMAQIASVPDEEITKAGRQMLQSAIDNLQEGRKKEVDNIAIIQQLVIAYGRQGQLGMSYLFQAEEAILTKNKDQAKRYADLAKKNLPANSPEILRANDILNSINRKEDKKWKGVFGK